jgi:hypothetical protein
MTSAVSLQQQLQNMWMSDFGARYPNNFSYFSGSQITMYIGDVLLDEAVFVSYQLQQNKKPIFGYASQYWDAVALGTVLVQGSLAVNYIDNKYLTILIFDVLSRKSGQTVAAPKANPRPMDQMSFMSQAAGYNILTDTGKQNFNQTMQAQKNQFWTSPSDKSAMPRPDNMPPIDIILTYGNNAAGSLGSTNKRLEAVVFTGETQTIEISGQPILEVYQFIARSIKNEIRATTPSATAQPGSNTNYNTVDASYLMNQNTQYTKI